MKDLIERQAVIEAVEHITSSMSVCVNTDECHGMKRMQRQAVIELANLPSAQPEPCKDAVSRADVVDMLEMFPFTEYSEYETAREVVKRLPSAQPEIVRCKDCKYYMDKWCLRYLYAFLPEDFCSYAERRTDDQSK